MEMIERIEKIEKPINELVSIAASLVIKTAEDYKAAGEYLRSIKKLQNVIEVAHKGSIDLSNKAHKAAIFLMRVDHDPTVSSENIIKSKMIAYDTLQEQIARKEQARLDEIARQQEEKLRATILARAQKAAEAGNEAKAERLQEKAETVQVIVPIVQKEVVKIEGQSIGGRWKARVVNLNALVKALSAGTASISFVTPNQTALDAQARATKDTLEIPGVEFYFEKSLSVRRG